MSKHSDNKNHAFIDSQNLYLAIKGLGWRLDYKRFRVYLREKYRIEKAYMFLGYLAENQELYKFLLVKVLAPSHQNCSALLKKAAGSDIAFLGDLQQKLVYKKKSTP